MLIQYKEHNFRKQACLIIEKANDIIGNYQAQGYELTLRQLYYQFVTRNIIPNTQREYDKLGVTINNARLAGLIDWEAIIDRTRTVEANTHFENPGHILRTAAETYKLDTRADQETYIEVWIEKEALIGVIEPLCQELDITYLACRGYYSQSAMWRAAQRIGDKRAVILHLGDHDPSGVDMTRDTQDRLTSFGTKARVERIALNMEQIEQYRPPPNFARLSDTRAAKYIDLYGKKSWELDALEPSVIASLIKESVDSYTDRAKRQVQIDKQEVHKQRLACIADQNKEATA